MKKTSISCLALTALVSSMLLGCANTPSTSKGQKGAATSTPTIATVPPSSFPGDPVGYAAAVVGGPGKEIDEGRFSWTTSRSRYQEIRKAMEAWCTHHGGKLPPAAQVFEPCTDGQGKTLTRFTVAHSGNELGVMVETTALAHQQELKRHQTLASHKQYVASNGAKGRITLVDGQRFEVLRFGSVGAPIDYSLNSVDGKDPRQLREVISVRRTSPAGEGTPGSFEVRFIDGSTSSNKHTLTNWYSELLPEGRMRSTSVTFGGIASSHMVLVVRSNPQSSPRQVLVAVREIATLQIDTIDTQPKAYIDVQKGDDKLAAALSARWTRAAAGKPMRAYTHSAFNGPNWCYSIAYETIESKLVCQQLWAEHEIALRAGVLTPSTTPATLAGEEKQTLARRSLW